MGRCLPIFNCGYLLNILQSNSLTQETIRFLQLSQCDAETADKTVPHVCCARNDDSLILDSDMNTTHLPALSAVFEDSKAIKKEKGEHFDDSIDSRKGWFNILPSRSECGRETIENRIYSGQVSKISLFGCPQCIPMFVKWSGKIIYYKINFYDWKLEKSLFKTRAHTDDPLMYVNNFFRTHVMTNFPGQPFWSTDRVTDKIK